MCNCGGNRLPNSVIVRMEAARLAASMTNAGTTQFGTHFNNVHHAMLGDVKEADLDKPKEPAIPPKQAAFGTPEQRQRLLVAPLTILPLLRDEVLEKLENAGVSTVGALAQWTAGQVTHHANISQDDMAKITAELNARHLRSGMSTDQLADWVKHGAKEGK